MNLNLDRVSSLPVHGQRYRNHTRPGKTRRELYVDLILSGVIPLRPGVHRGDLRCPDGRHHRIGMIVNTGAIEDEVGLPTRYVYGNQPAADGDQRSNLLRPVDHANPRSCRHAVARVNTGSNGDDLLRGRESRRAGLNGNGCGPCRYRVGNLVIDLRGRHVE